MLEACLAANQRRASCCSLQCCDLTVTNDALLTIGACRPRMCHVCQVSRLFVKFNRSL